MKPRARYRARPPSPAEEGRGARQRWVGRGVVVLLLLGYAALMWYVVFPYVDRTFVNQPAL